MKPYYDDGTVTIYHGNALELLPALAPVDVILTDPPYGNGTEYGAYEDTPDALLELVRGLFPLVIEKATRVVLTPGNANAWLYPQPSWTLAWVTPAGAGSGPWGFSCWQPILVYGADPYLKAGLGRRPDVILKTEASDANGHPCPKPIDLWRLLLQRVSVTTNDVVLDPFMGSGTTLRAAKDLGRRAIGIELEERFCEIAARRCSQEVLDVEEKSWHHSIYCAWRDGEPCTCKEAAVA